MKTLLVLLFSLTLFAAEGNPVVIINLPENLQNQLTSVINQAVEELGKVMPDCKTKNAIVLVIPNPTRLQVIGQCLDEPEKGELKARK